MSAPPELTRDSAAGVIARVLKARGVDRVFGLCGGHIMPLWMRVDAEGIAIVDARDERAAVYMAHAYGQLTGQVGVALVTAGPGVTNAMTGIANAHVARVPLLVLSGVPPRAQENRGALQDIVHTDLVRSITRYARTVREASLVPQELDAALSHALGIASDPGPAYLDFPTDTLRAEVPQALQLPAWFESAAASVVHAEPRSIEAAANLISQSRRPLVISGRGARHAGGALRDLLEATGAAYLDTGESRGLVPDDHPSVVGAMRGQVMGDCDLVITVGRRLDFQLGYGSPAVFGAARWLRIADAPGELRDNRRGDVEVYGNIAAALTALANAVRGRVPVDAAWIDKLRTGHRDRSQKLRTAMRAAADGSDGRMHPNRLLAALADRLPADAIVVADGGDFLAFARVGLQAATYLDPGSLGCIGVGTPFGIGAALACPGRLVVVATGDGAFGFNAMEIDTAVRHHVPLLIVVANNGAWQIEVHDQATTYGKVVGTRLQHADHAAMARAFNMHAERVAHAAELAGAVDRALQVVHSGSPALLDVLVSSDAVSADAKSGLAWVPDLQPLAAWDASERQFRANS